MGTSKSTKRNLLIADLQAVAAKNPKVVVTRNFYRSRGKYPEAAWQAHFATFREFALAANINVAPTKAAIPDLSSEVTGNTWNLSLPKTRIHTLDELLEFCEVDLGIWQVERFVVNKWEMGYVDGDKKAAEHPLYQVKATLKKRPEIVAVRKEIERLKDEAKKFARIPKTIARKSNDSGNMLEINIPDIHFGKLAWGTETMYENFDSTIAEQMYMRALATLLERVKGYSFDKIIFVVGNDLFNSDNIENQTTKGTIVTTDGRYHKTFWKVRRTITRCIEMLREIAPVEVLLVPGNHDNLSVWHLGDSLECYFANYEDVTIDNEPTPRKYVEWGSVMLMLCHGDKGKRAEYPQLMASERSEMWGRTKYRECHTGHTHMTKTDEKYGCRVRVLPALCPPDDWHSEQGLVGNLRNAEAYVWNAEEGLIAIAIYTDNAQEPIETVRTVVGAA